MKKYYIVDEQNYFWCYDKLNKFGFWSTYKTSLSERVEKSFIFIVPLYLAMKLNKVKCKLVKI